MRVLTANVNGIRAAARRGGLEWIAEQAPDVVALQEVRANDKQLETAIDGSWLATLERTHVPSASAGREGVAIFSRYPIVAARLELGGFDEPGRWVEADLQVADRTVTVISTYVHTGEADTPKQDAKYAFLTALEARMAELLEHDAIVMGDFNVAHTANDLKNWKGNRGKAGFLPQEQDYLTRLTTSGWADVVRAHHGDMPGPYSWWSWRGKAFDNDSGWRIDYQFASPSLASQVSRVATGRAASYALRWSDHAAVVVDYDVDAAAGDTTNDNNIGTNKE